MLPEEERNSLEVDFTREEILEALRDTNKNSAPGPAGFYKYIMSQIPNTFTKAINELAFVPKLQNSRCFDWIKNRHIVYIPNPGKSTDKLNTLGHFQC